MLSVVFSGKDVNNFVLGSNLRPVIVQSATDYRMQPDDIDSWSARNNLGERVPFPSFITTEWTPVSPRLSRMNGLTILEIFGTPGSGISSGVAMDGMEELTAQLIGG